MARKTAVENEDGLWLGYLHSDKKTQEQRTKKWNKAQKAIQALAKKSDTSR